MRDDTVISCMYLQSVQIDESSGPERRSPCIMQTANYPLLLLLSELIYDTLQLQVQLLYREVIVCIGRRVEVSPLQTVMCLQNIFFSDS